MTYQVGDAVPSQEHAMTLTSMVAYAGATWDWHKMHYDPTFVEEKKLPGPVVDGQVFGALLVKQLQDWLGPDSFVSKLNFDFKALVFAGETVRCEGVVTEAHDDRLVVSQHVHVIDADGAVVRTAVGKAGATVLIGRSDGLGAK